MGNLLYAAFISLLFVWFGGSISYLYALATHTATGVEVLQGCFAWWLILTIALYAYMDWLDKRNEEARKQRKEDEKNRPDKRQ